jgi:transposase-like protein
MACIVETLRIENGLRVENLRYYRCRSCGSRFYDDEAIHRIQAARRAKAESTTAR